MATDNRRAFLALLDAQAPLVAKAFRDIIADAVSVAQVRALEAAIEAGDIARAIEVAVAPASFWAPLDRAIGEAFLAGALYQQAALPKLPFGPGGGRLVIRFDGRVPRAEAWVRERSSTLIREIVEDQRAGVRRVIEAGAAAGRNPRDTALDITGRMQGQRRMGGIVGLHSNSVDAVIRARSELRDPAGMGDYLSRTRRDKRFDGVVKRAIGAGKPVAAADVDRIVARYADRLLALRGETIARSESLAALNAGRREGMAQVIEDNGNEVRVDDVVRAWDASGDARTRPAHAQMDGQVRPFDEPFAAPDGSRLMHPGDTSLGASGGMTIACRCYMAQRIDFLAVARRRRSAA